ncbi:Ig-like domain-containing protein [Taibaiella koreensis]|uniref:Ig-like domain-containing protein n=1 Tax=Taibaiella koreensis TaxID=1268548 RepID=UPI000E5A043C|nr:T9SS type A sorting domain-containing protein [Taibaiella koreensis]
MQKKSTLKNLWEWYKKGAAMALLLLCTLPPAMAQPGYIVSFCSSGPPSSSTSSSYGPMYSTSTANATSRFAYIYPASQLTAIAGSTINNVYFHRASTTLGMLGTPNCKIYLKQVTNADWGSTTLTWATEIATASLVYDGNPTSIVGTAAGWKNFPLTTPFPYTGGTQNLAVFVEYQNTTASNTINWSYEFTSPCVNTSNNNTTKYVTNTSATLPATLGSSTYRRPYIGFDYVFPPCATLTLPTSGTVSAFPGNICVSGPTTLTFTPATTMPAASGITYKWQSSATAGGTYTDIPGAVTTTPTYTTGALTAATTYFKCVVLCNTTTVLTSSASNSVTVSNPGSPTGTAGSRCGPGTVNLSATGASGTTLRWYDATSGGAPLGTGNSFTTPYITATRNFYVTAGTAPAPANATVGAGASVTSFSYVTIFAGGWGGYKHQFLIREAEMIAAGIMPGDAINTISVDNANGTATYNGFTMSLNSTPVTALTPTFETGAIAAFGPVNYTTTVGINTFTLTAPYTYTGGSLLIETCWSNATTSNPYSNLRYDNTTYPATHYAYQDSQPPSVICAGPANNGTPENARPQFKFNFMTACQGPRVAVQASVSAPPALTKTAPLIVCDNAVGTFQVTSPVGQYSNYAWTPAAELYTNAAGTVPYVAGTNAPTVYFKSTVTGARQFALYATNSAAPNCAFADTVRTWVQPDSVTISAVPDTVCAPSGSTTLRLVPSTGYAPNGIQWQQSTDNITYTDIAGATGVSYTTPGLTANRYYKALIKSNTAGVNCQAPVKLIVVANPSLISWADSFHCGPGTVNLQATAGGSGNIRWYANATDNSPVGSGSPWVTPYLGATTTYYVESGTGAIQPPPAFIGTGTSATYWGYLPYFGANYASNKVQWMLKGSELQAAGFAAGYIMEIAFDVTTKSGNTNISSLTYSMKQVASTATLGATFNTGLQQVYTATNFNPTANAINAHTLQNPFYWDGSSNIILEECSNNPTGQGGYANVKYHTAPALYFYTNTNPQANCGSPTGVYSSSTRPNIRISMLNGCRSARQPVTAFIRPVPDVDLGTDINECVDSGAIKVLDAGVQPNTPQFLWDNGSISQVRAISTSGTYYVKVTNQYTCVKSDTININLRNNPVVRLGNDTTVCNGATLALDAGGDGISYFWSTGATTRVLNINEAGSYNVFVTNNLGCIKSDTIVVTMAGELPTIDGINISNNGVNTFHFTAVNPQNVIGYDWDFGDGSPHSFQASPFHSYDANPANYIVVLRLSSSCGFLSDSTSAHIVGIHQLNVSNDEMTVYPNPAKATATILNRGALKMEKIAVYNVLGQVVYEATADSKDKHTLSLGSMAAGVYTIQVYTDKGTVARKLEILK